jgi:hypothetical protein
VTNDDTIINASLPPEGFYTDENGIARECRCMFCETAWFKNSAKNVEKAEEFAGSVPDMSAAWAARDAVVLNQRLRFDIVYGKFLKCRLCGGWNELTETVCCTEGCGGHVLDLTGYTAPPRA